MLGGVLLLSAAALPAQALPVMDLSLDDLLPMASELRKTLNLNANQQTLWQQTENKTRQLMRERHARRERLQTATQAGLAGARVELRDLVGALDAETAAAAAEEKQAREWWLNVNDALDETQRGKVAALAAEQLLRAADSGARPGATPRGKEEGGEHRQGGGRGRGGAGMGGVGIGTPGG
ncbi:hypothetical protein H7U20_04465 [Rugamonas sp. CCM 8940]|nr:hypothetical protein [Rugamonas sp. CCM 8940]